MTYTRVVNLVFSLVSLVLIASGQETLKPYDCAPLLDNPWGDCDCDSQITIGPDCTQAFICNGTSNGCLLECQPGYLLKPDFGINGTNVSWTCHEETNEVCKGLLKVYCSGTDKAVPIEGLNDPSRCSCDNEIFFSPDCRHADYCVLEVEGTYTLRNGADCINDEYIVMDFLTWEDKCSTEQDNCPGKGGFSSGCSSGPHYVPNNPKCNYTEKPFMTDVPCGSCDEQLFVNNDCTQGFLCMNNLPQGETGEGCLVECPEGYKLYTEFLTDKSGYVEFYCRDELDMPECMSEFYINCPNDPVDPNVENCECDGEVMVSPGCKTATRCHMQDGAYIKQNIDCAADQTVDLCQDAWDLCCSNEGSDGCPGKGGFRAGCGSSTMPTSTEGQETTTAMVTNTTSMAMTTTEPDGTRTTNNNFEGSAPTSTTMSTTEPYWMTTTNENFDVSMATITTTTTTEPDGTTSTLTVTDILNENGSKTVIETKTTTRPDGKTSTETEVSVTNLDDTGSMMTTVSETHPDGATTTNTSSSTVNLDGTITNETITCKSV